MSLWGSIWAKRGNFGSTFPVDKEVSSCYLEESASPDQVTRRIPPTAGKERLMIVTREEDPTRITPNLRDSSTERALYRSGIAKEK